MAALHNPIEKRWDIYRDGALVGIAPTLEQAVALDQEQEGHDSSRSSRPAPRLTPPVVVDRVVPPLVEAGGALYAGMTTIATGAEAVRPAIAIYQALAGGPLPSREDALAYARARKVLR